MKPGMFDVGLIENKKRVVGICLGWDAAAEHEFGIRIIMDEFGIPGSPRHVPGGHDLVGADVRTTTRVPSYMRFYENLNGKDYLLCYRFINDLLQGQTPSAELFDRTFRLFPEDETVACWDESDFVIRTTTGIGLGEIHKALLEKDALIFCSSAAPFGGTGLVIVIRSRVPRETLDTMKAADLERLRLRDATEEVYRATALPSRLKAAGKGYFALSPRWLPKENPPKMAHPIWFWLNPVEQSSNNYGYFTVEDLLLWAQDKGPVPKSPVQ
ncbi:MAG: hypothetical protein IT406_01770 [Candidatus Yanofskybacteria bacterium]|nr:hypothetical protein [Candidatus Yanofskybacteria bacterium]